jgi:eukaryotic-like serine/threonine-protein kinase
LARASLAGGAPREVTENVSLADFGPRDELLVVRSLGEKTRIEYPAGTTLLEVEGWISRARVSPQGDRVAFLHHPLNDDDRGSVEVVDLKGGRRTLAGPFWTLSGLAWTPDGREVWFGGARQEEPAFLIAVTLDGRERVVTRAPGRLCLEDIARDGRVLLRRADFGARVVGLVPGRDREIDLTWYDSTHPVDLSRDGSVFLFVEGGEASIAEVQTFLRRTDGSPAVHLAEGWGRALSPDGKWALVSPKAPFDTLTLVPTGPGETKSLSVAPLTVIKSASFTPDGGSLVVLGAAGGGPLRLWTLHLEGGAPKAIGDEGMTRAIRPSPDGRMVAALTKDGRSFLVPLDGGASQPLPRIAIGDFPIGWADGGRALLVRRAWRRDQLGAEIVTHEVATGKERPWRTLTPRDTTGMFHPAEINGITITPDARSYVYHYSPMETALYVAEGLR